MGVVTITKEKVLGKLKGLKVDKSPGPDGPYPRVLKEMAEEMSPLLRMYLEVHGEIAPSQHGFIKGTSRLTNLLEFFEEVMTKLDKGEPVV
eukprot:g24825.t1